MLRFFSTFITMYPTLRRSIHKPLIRFIGKRQWPSRSCNLYDSKYSVTYGRLTDPEPQHPHPFAPAELKQSFSDFISKFQGSSSQSAHTASSSPPLSASKLGPNVQVFQEFWQAPERLWKHDLDETEIELAMVCGYHEWFVI